MPEQQFQSDRSTLTFVGMVGKVKASGGYDAVTLSTPLFTAIVKGCIVIGHRQLDDLSPVVSTTAGSCLHCSLTLSGPYSQRYLPGRDDRGDSHRQPARSTKGQPTCHQTRFFPPGRRNMIKKVKKRKNKQRYRRPSYIFFSQDRTGSGNKAGSQG